MEGFPKVLDRLTYAKIKAKPGSQPSPFLSSCWGQIQTDIKRSAELRLSKREGVLTSMN